MSDKYLPIKIFEKRKDYDDRYTEGGGDDREPSWVLNGETLNEHVKYLEKNILDIRNELKDRTERKLPMVLATTIKEAAIAKSHRKNIVGMLDLDGKDNVIGLFGDRRLLSLVSDEELLDRMHQIITDYKNAVTVSAIDDMEVYQPFVEKNDNTSDEYRIRLIDYNDYEKNQLVKRIFEQFCKDNEITIQNCIRFTTDMFIYRVTLDGIEKVESINQFEGLYSAEITRPVSVAIDAFHYDKYIEIKEPEEGVDYPLVGVLDTGVSHSKHLSPWIDKKEFTNYPEQYQNNVHGTFVGGILEYGDELNDWKTSSIKGVRIRNAIVFPDLNKEKLYPEDLIEHIREAVEKNPDVKIWNLSLGTDVESELDEFSEYGMALDNIQDENDILIIKSAGNCYNFMQDLPKGRIAKMADSVRSLVIGSIAHEKGMHDFSDINMPSPFTRIGPGPSSIIKPDLVFYGGNAGKMGCTGVKTFTVFDDVYDQIGTSFSTPAVTRIAVELDFLMNEDFDPLMIRALLIHYAKYPKNIKMSMPDKIMQMGFGVPIGARDILYNSPDEITLILRDTLEKGSFIEMFDFPFPQSLVDKGGFFRGQIVLTMVGKTLVNDKQAGEYCQSNLDVFFGTYETEKDRDITKSIIKNPKGLDNNQNLLSDAIYSAKAKGIHPITGFERECTLVKYGKKFHPVKKYAIDLSDITPSNREKYLSADRKWYLKIEGLYRDFIETDAQKKDYDLSQEFCMVLTIKDPDNIAPVYNEVTQQLTYKNFIHHDVRVRNIIQVESQNSTQVK